MPGKVKALNVSENLSQLNSLAELPSTITKNPSLLVKSAPKIFKRAVDHRDLGDEENAYVMYMKFLNIYQVIMKSVDYKKDKKFFDNMLGKTPLDALLEAEKLSESLKSRYEEREAERVAARQAAVDLPDIPDDDLDDLLASDVKAAPVTEEVSTVQVLSPSISPVELYDLLSLHGSDRPLVFDVRDNEQHKLSRLNLIDADVVWIPSEYLSAGTLSNKIRAKLDVDGQALFDARANYQRIVMFDSNSKFNDLDQSDYLCIVKDAIYKWDQQVKLKIEPQILEGGFEEWTKFYPQLTSNPLAFQRQPEKKTAFIDFQALSFPNMDSDEENEPKNENNGIDLPSPTSLAQQPLSNVRNGVATPISSMTNIPVVDRSVKPRPIERPIEQNRPYNGNVSVNVTKDPLVKPSVEIRNGVTEPKTHNHIQQPASQQPASQQPVIDRSKKPSGRDQNSPVSDSQAAGPITNSGMADQDLAVRLNEKNQQLILETGNRLRQLNSERAQLAHLEQKKQMESVAVAELMRKKRQLEMDITNVERKLKDATQLKKEHEGTTTPQVNRQLKPQLDDWEQRLAQLAIDEQETSLTDLKPATVLNENGDFENALDPLNTAEPQPNSDVNKQNKQLEEKQQEQNQKNKQLEDDLKRKEAEKKRLNDEKIRLEAERRKNEELKQQEIQKAEERRRAEARVLEAKRQEERAAFEAKRKQEDDRKALEAKKKLEEERKALEAKRRQEEERKALEAKRRQEEEERQKLEAQRKYEDDARRRQEEERKKALNEQTRLNATQLPPGTTATMRLKSDETEFGVDGDVTTNESSRRSNMKRFNSQPNLAQLDSAEDSQSFTPAKIDRTLKPASANPELRRQIEMKEYIVYADKQRLNNLSAEYGRVKPGLTGLYNMGNTCYMNSTLQCLSHTMALTAFFSRDTYDYAAMINVNNKKGSKGAIAQEYAFLISILWKGHYRYVVPKDFKYVFGRVKDDFSSYSQMDSQEFLVHLLDILHEDLNTEGHIKSSNAPDIPVDMDDRTGALNYLKHRRETNKSIIETVFSGVQKSSLECHYCGYTSRRFDVFNCLPLQITTSSRTRLANCLEQYQSETKAEGHKCDKCGRQEGYNKLDLWQLPDVLVIMFKRFQLLDYRQFSKKTNMINFPHNLSLSGKDGRGPKDYRLYGVVNHFGSMESGHYTAFCKLDDRTSEQWYKFNDDVVTPMSSRDVEEVDCDMIRYGTVFLISGRIIWPLEKPLFDVAHVPYVRS